MMTTRIVPLIVGFLILNGCSVSPPPAPFGPTPSSRQLDWQQLEYYAFVHFNMNTFTDFEWGHGNESPATFLPTQLDCRQWARTAKEAGMRAIILTAKHHDGFCLWPSRYTEHSVKNSPWRDGKGDVLRELADACREYGLKFGLYISPWDRNNPLYGKEDEAYNNYFKQQLTEILTGYGEIFEVWFDGANGDRDNPEKFQEYDWSGFVATVRKHQPDAVIFSDAGPDIRWVGNERGRAGKTNWSRLNRDDFYPGIPGKNRELNRGQRDGTHWLPAEVDVSIRPGWYYHEDQDDRVKTPEQLLDIYYTSVGRNANLLLNLPVDRRGLVHEKDIGALMGLKAKLNSIFKKDLALQASASASNERGGSSQFSADRALDGNPSTYWATNDNITEAWLELHFQKPTDFDHVVLQEHIALGQRVEEFSIETFDGTSRQTIASGTTVGYQRIMKTPRVTADRIRVHFKARACPTISTISIFNGP